MALIRVRFGDYIRLIKEKCGISNLSVNDVSGINRDKEFFEPSKQVGSDTSSYKIVPPNCFACNIMHVGRDVVLPIALNTTCKNKIVSPAYTVFEWTGDEVLLKEFLFIMLKSNEMDRYFWFHCDSSVRDGMDWDAFCDIELEVPSIEIQKKYVAIYEGLLANLRSYEKGLDDLKLVCDGYIEDLRRKYPCISFSSFIEERKENNKNGDDLIMKGIGLKGFIEPNQLRSKESLKKCNIFYLGDFVYAPSSFKNGVISYNNRYSKALCSEEYVVFYITKKERLNPYYLEMWLKRKELGRSIDFYVLDSVRNRFYFEDLKTIIIPIPEIKIQKLIAHIYCNYLQREEYIERLKQQISSICPILIRGSILEGKSINA